MFLVSYDPSMEVNRLRRRVQSVALLPDARSVRRAIDRVSIMHRSSPSSPLPPWQNHLQSPADNSAERCEVSFQAKSKPRAVGTLAGVLFAGWPASNGTIVANPRRRRGEWCFLRASYFASRGVMKRAVPGEFAGCSVPVLSARKPWFPKGFSHF